MKAESERVLHRIFVDLFGPLINIETVEPFKDISARYAPLDKLVAAVNAKLTVKLRGDWFREVDAPTLLEVCEKALRHENRHPGLIDRKVLDALINAALSGAEVVIVSTVPEKKVFDAAIEAIVARMQAINSTVVRTVKFEHTEKFEPTDANRKWADILKEYSKEPRFTYVLHDTPWKELEVPDDRTLWNVWVPSGSGDNLAEVIKTALDNERKRAPLVWLRQNSELRLQEFEALDGYVIYNPERRKHLAATVKKLAQRRGAPTCVFLAGSPGSGKSYFVKQCAKQLPGGKKPVLLNLSGVKEVENALEIHIRTIIDKSPGVAFIDEVDTEVLHNFAFRYLLSPMDGNPLTVDGIALQAPAVIGAASPGDSKLENLIWFFAGSAGRTREDFHKLAEKDRKVADFLSRISYWIELPGTDNAMDAMFIAITMLKKNCPTLNTIEKKVLLFFANAAWRDVRHLRLYVENIVEYLRTGVGTHLAHDAVAHVLRDDDDVELEKTLAAVDDAEVDGMLKVYD